MGYNKIKSEKKNNKNKNTKTKQNKTKLTGFISEGFHY